MNEYSSAYRYDIYVEAVPQGTALSADLSDRNVDHTIVYGEGVYLGVQEKAACITIIWPDAGLERDIDEVLRVFNREAKQECAMVVRSTVNVRFVS